MAETQAKLNNLRIAPRKVRLVADLIKGMSAAEARAELTFSKKRSAPAILKLLQSAVANAKNKRRFEAAPIYIPRKKKDRKKNKRRKKGSSERKTGKAKTFGRRKKRRNSDKKGRGAGQKVFPA